MYKLSLLILLLATCGLAAQEVPPKPWTSSAGAGLAITSGNSDTQNLNISFATTYDPKKDHIFKAVALYILGEADGEKQVDKATASARNERTLSDQFFWFGEVSYLRDPFRAINYQISPIAGAGYHFIQSETQKLSFDSGLGATVESNRDLGRRTSGAVQAGETYAWTISSTSKLEQRLNAIWKTEDFEDALYHFDAGVNTTVATRVELKVAYVYDYKNKPAVAGVKRGDSSLFAAVLFKF